MNVNETVQYLRQHMPEFSGNDLEKKEKIAMYIYLELGKMKSFDEKYLFGDKKTKEKMRKLSKLKRHRIDDIAKNKKVVCITISELYKRLLKEFGIKSKIKRNCNKHEYIHIILSNGEYIVADLQQDLYNIQTKSRTKNFGRELLCQDANLKKISDEELYEMQKEIGYVSSKTDYTDEKIINLKKQLKDCEPNKILEKILTNEDICQFNSKLEYAEFYNYYRAILKQFPSGEKGVYCNYFNCFRKEENTQEKQYCMCIYSIYKDNVNVYLSSNKTNQFIPVDLDTLSYLESDGLYLSSMQDKKVKPLRQKMYEHNKQKIIKKWSNEER